MINFEPLYKLLTEYYSLSKNIKLNVLKEKTPENIRLLFDNIQRRSDELYLEICKEIAIYYIYSVKNDDDFKRFIEENNEKYKDVLK